MLRNNLEPNRSESRRQSKSEGTRLGRLRGWGGSRSGGGGRLVVSFKKASRQWGVEEGVDSMGNGYRGGGESH